MLKMPKTPHINPLGHFYRMFNYFAASSLITTVLTASFASTLAGWGMALLASLLIAAGSLAGGILVTMMTRNAFGLIQTGRILQYSGFILSALISTVVVGFLLSAFVSFGSPLLTGLLLFALAFGSATLTGEVPTKGRTWLPKRRATR